MISASADTLSTARRLQNEFGMDQRASEGVAIAIHEHLIQNVATKDDLALMQAELEKQIIATKDDLALTQAELEKQIIATRDSLTLTQAEMEKQIEAVRSELKQEVAGIRVELHQEIAETNQRIDRFHTEVATEFKVLYRNLWGMGIGIIAVMVALLKLL